MTTALTARAVHLLQTFLGLPQAFQGTFVLRDRLSRVGARRGLRLLHLVSGLVELTTQLLHLRVAPFTRQTLQLSRRFTRFFDQLLLLALIATATAAVRRLLSAAALFFERRLLPAGELFQTPFGFTLLLFGLLLLRALHRLVLVLHLIELVLEKMSALQSEAFILCEMEGFSSEEAAEALGMNDAAFATRLDDARTVFNAVSARLRAQRFWIGRGEGSAP